jgi:hypothetical protein
MLGTLKRCRTRSWHCPESEEVLAAWACSAPAQTRAETSATPEKRRDLELRSVGRMFLLGNTNGRRTGSTVLLLAVMHPSAKLLHRRFLLFSGETDAPRHVLHVLQYGTCVRR